MRLPGPLLFSLLILIAGAVSLAACDADSGGDPPGFSELLEDRETFGTLIDALEETGIGAELETGGPYTVLAPTDQAFMLLGAGTLAMLREPGNLPVLTRVLRAHIVPGALRIEEFRDGERLTALDGTELEVRVERGRVTVGGLEVRRALEATNGVAYSVERLYLEHLTIAERLKVSELLRSIRLVLDEAGELDRLGGEGPFTLFVPLDDAFDALGDGSFDRLLANPSILDRVASSHLVQGVFDTDTIEDGLTVISESGSSLTFTVGPDMVSVDGVRILLPDIRTSNGVIHLIADVMTSDLRLNEAATLAGLSFWLDAVRAAGLEAVLEDDGPYTVFAPTNAAFTQIGGAAHIAFMEREGLVQRVIPFHVVPGLYPLARLAGETRLPTLEGDEIRVSFVNQQVRVGLDALAEVQRGDIVARNGVIHTLRAVVHPRLSLLEALVFERRTRFVRGIRLAGLEAEFESGGPYTVFAFTDEAFNSDPELLALFSPARAQQLLDYLSYHTGEGAYPFEALADGLGELPTRYGIPLTYLNTPGGLFADTTFLFPAAPSLINPSNGALYRLNGVLPPPEPE